eukprot:SAG31_NODE_1437_length_8339_cov_26.148058_2_plen_222_part_00
MILFSFFCFPILFSFLILFACAVSHSNLGHQHPMIQTTSGVVVCQFGAARRMASVLLLHKNPELVAALARRGISDTSKVHISSHLISSHLISSHLISSHLISSHLISSCLISSYLILSHLISSYLISSHLISSYLISSHLISSHLISSHLISSHLISSHLISSHLISSCLISSHLISSHLISSYLILSCKVHMEPWPTGPTGKTFDQAPFDCASANHIVFE